MFALLLVKPAETESCHKQQAGVPGKAVMAKPNVIVTIVSHEHRLHNLLSVDSKHSTASQLLLNHRLEVMRPEACPRVTVRDSGKHSLPNDCSTSPQSHQSLQAVTVLWLC